MMRHSRSEIAAVAEHSRNYRRRNGKTTCKWTFRLQWRSREFGWKTRAKMGKTARPRGGTWPKELRWFDSVDHFRDRRRKLFKRAYSGDWSWTENIGRRNACSKTLEGTKQFDAGGWYLSILFSIRNSIFVCATTLRRCYTFDSENGHFILAATKVEAIIGSFFLLFSTIHFSGKTKTITQK